jgi:predicted double-glycine peptidase
MRAVPLVVAFTALLVWQTPAAIASDVPITTGGFAYNVKVTSLKEARFKSVIKQRYDFSCGSAALATLLTFHYNRPTDEEQIFKAMYEAGDKKKIQTVGFSLLDMKEYLAAVGYRADGFKMSLDRVAEIGVPAIALIDTKGYKHFVVVKGLGGDRLVVGDPGAGLRVMTKEKFQELWNGIVFVIRNKANVGREHFNLRDDWEADLKAPYGTALSRQSLASFTVHLWRGTNTF